MITYENVEDKCIKKTNEDGREWFIPIDPANSDYQAYLKYLEENN
jgi:hypothetical protein